MKYSNIFDSHAHYDDPAFDPDRDKLLASLPGLGVCRVVNCGADLATSEKSIALAAEYPFVFAAAGVHPEEAGRVPSGWTERLDALLSRPKVAAAGEIGLDYHSEQNPPRGVQKSVFEKQIELAAAHGLPIIVHDRDAHGDTMAVLKKYRPKGVVHCFSGSVEMAREVLKLGMVIGLGGAVTFKNARVPVEVAKMVPEDRFVLETDCPYMAPVPFRGRRNDSSLIAFTAERIARIRGTGAQALIDRACQNAKALYGIE
ncbi:MAG: TatD family hydrolase [Oscillospiraceae bacterium]|nr:TatD family hydrolase [Oscillospiraceae bacterium]MCI1990970.1 TatD family hydrolase [Oscillospiraceae bacterium]MCI2034528.1 TatD family hydrolase [Oscillospiraceae bacterium]